jgi:hypothetical protein
MAGLSEDDMVEELDAVIGGCEQYFPDAPIEEAVH